VFFRAPTLEGAQTYLGTLFAGEAVWSTTVTPLVALLLAVGAMTQIIPNGWFDRLAIAYDRASTAVKVAVPAGVIFLVALAAPGGVPPFIYFQFQCSDP
jgi:hypothetical protein